MSGIPSGPVTLDVALLDAAGKAQFTGRGSAQVQKGQTASAVVYVSPTPGAGSLEIVIQPDSPSSEVLPPCLSGGYCTLLPLDDARVQKAAAFAARKIKPTGNFTHKVTKAAEAASPGLNIALSLDLMSGNVTNHYLVIVSEDVKGNMTLVESTSVGSSTSPSTGTK